MKLYIYLFWIFFNRYAFQMEYPKQTWKHFNIIVIYWESKVEVEPYKTKRTKWFTGEMKVELKYQVKTKVTVTLWESKLGWGWKENNKANTQLD